MKTPNKIKITFVTIALIAATALTGLSQASVGTGGTGGTPTGNPFTPALLPLPQSIVPSGAPGTAGAVSNFVNGYTGIIGIVTNVVGPLYTPSLNGFSPTVTNYFTNFSTVFPSIYVPYPGSTIELSYRGACSGSPTNAVFAFNYSLTPTPGSPSTTNAYNLNWSVALNQGIGTNTTAMLVLTNQPFGYLWLTQTLWQSTNGSILTNLDGGIYYAVEPNAGQ